MQLHLQTRGRTVDYAFLGASPAEMWWLSFRGLTSFEEPTILIIGDGTGWRCYLSGIPSGRQDRVGTQIRYSVAASGESPDQEQLVLGLITKWIDDIASDKQSGFVQGLLDDAFSEADVERLLRDRTAGAGEEVERCLRVALERIRMEPSSTVVKTTNSWVGALTSHEARQAFVYRVSEILHGEHEGAAVLLNLIGTAEEASRLLDRYSSVAVLFGDLELDLSSDIIPLEKKKPKSKRTPRRRTGVGNSS